MCSLENHTIASKKFYSNIEVISWVGLISSSLTLISTSIIIIFIFYKGIFSLSQIKPFLHLSIADFFLSFVWFSADLRYITKYGINKNLDNALKCLKWQLTGEIFHLVTFGFTVNYSINVYLQMKNISYRVYGGYSNEVESINRRMVIVERLKKSLYFVFWALPLLLLLPIMVNIEGHVCLCQRCVILIDVPRLVHINIFYQAYGFVLLAVCLSISFFVVLVLYISTLKMYWRTMPAYRTDRQRKQLRNMQFRITLYVAVFTVCWTPALIIACIKSNEMLNGQHLKQTDVIYKFPIYILQALLTPLQGVLNTIVYGWSRKSFRLAARPSDGLTSRLLDNAITSEYLSDDNLQSPADSDASFGNRD